MAESENNDLKRSGSPDHGSEEAESKTSTKSADIPTFCYDVKPELHQGISSVADGVDLSSRVMMDEVNKLYVCHLCDFRTAFRNSLLNHQAVHSDSRPWVCNMCEYAAKRKQDLKKHLHTIHGIMVDSTMLKPVLDSQIRPSHPSRGEGSEDNSSDSSKVTNSIMDPEGSAFFLHGNSDLTGLPTLRSPGHHESKHVKQEMSSPGSPGHLLPRTTPDSDSRTVDDSPDDDLPISFLAVQPTTSPFDNRASEDEQGLLPQTFAGPMNIKLEGKASQNVSMNQHFTPPSLPIPQAHHSRSPYNPSLSSLYNTPQSRKRYQYNNMPIPETSSVMGSMRSGPSPIKRARSPERDDSLCSSSGGVAQGRAMQTQTAFLCEHCNIMFFQRAMYLMHMGLHSSDDPWQCSVCGGRFTEVYSFTSHFINQH